MLRVHLVDGTYELFRHFHGLRRFSKGKDRPFGAVAGVLGTVLQMLEAGATHVGVATDHVVESSRNELWPDYKTAEGLEPAILDQFEPLEAALADMGVVVWPMTELEADDALAAAARIAADDPAVERVCIWSPDKDLAQAVRGDRVVQMIRKPARQRKRGKAGGLDGVVRDEPAVREKFGVGPRLIPDYLALVGDTADGYPGIAGIGPGTAARLLNEHGPIEDFPARVVGGEKRERALLFKDLARLRSETELFASVADLEWAGPTQAWGEWEERLGQPLVRRAAEAYRPDARTPPALEGPAAP